MDDIKNCNITWKTRIWSWKRGFSASRVQTYGIDEGNLSEHLPDFEYYRLHPINGQYSKWIDDKLTMMYILAPFFENLPKYYYQIEEKDVLKLKDCPVESGTSISDVIKLLERIGDLAAKPISGSLGEGFYWLRYRDDRLYINCKEVDYTALEELLSNTSGYIVTEYVVAHDDLLKVNRNTPNTIRVQVARSINEKAKITGCFIRFGTINSGVAESPTRGGVIARVGILDGHVDNAYLVRSNTLQSIKEHPDSKVKINFYIPHWTKITERIIEISEYIPQMKYMGFDIVVTNEGFKILEINSLTSTTVLPFYYPLLLDSGSKDLFKSEKMKTKYKT